MLRGKYKKILDELDELYDRGYLDEEEYEKAVTTTLLLETADALNITLSEYLQILRETKEKR